MMPLPIRTYSLLRLRIPCIVRLLMLATAALLAAGLSAGLPAGLAAQSFAARLYGQDDGLDNQAIVDLAQDAAGHLWIGTENGLVRYDGARFIAFGRDRGLNDPRTYNIHIDHLGTIWAANRAGLFYFDGDRFREVQIGGRSILIGLNSKLASNSRGELLVVSGNEGFLSIEKDPASGAWRALSYSDRHPSFPRYGTVHGVTVDRHDRLWFGCGTSICGFSAPDHETPGMAQQPLATLDGVPPGVYDSLLVQQQSERQNGQQNGRLWARSFKFIVTWMPGDRKVSEVSAQLTRSQTGFQDTIYRNLIEDRLGNVLTPTTDGFATWDGSRWEETASTTQGPIDGATALLADREGGMWIGTAGKGLLQALGYKHWVNYTLAQGLKSQLIFGIAIDQRRRLWLGSPRGIDVIPPDASRPIASPLANEPDARWIEHLKPTPDGGMWAAALHGHLYHIDRNDHVDKRAFIPADTKRIRLDSRGTLWIASITGLFHLDCPPLKSVCHAIKVEGAFTGTDFPEAMQFDRQGDLWVATRAGLFVVRKGAVEHIPIQGFGQGLSELAIAPDQTIWLAGRFPGLIHVRVNGDIATIIDTHAVPELASDYVEILASDAEGRVWAGTDHGVNVLYQGRTTLIDMQDGLIWNDTDWNAFLEENDGSVWIGTSGGVSHLLDPDAVINRPPFNAEVDMASYGLMKPGEHLLKPGSTTPWNRSPFFIGFDGLTFRDNRSLIFHYRMEGLDGQNIETHSPFARFQQLPPGTYNFVIVAEDRGHNTLSTPAAFSFTLSPPWWRTRLFFSLEGIAAIAFLLIIWRWSNLALLAQRKRLQSLVAERTVELEHLAVTDALTGLLNRGAIMKILANEADAARKRNLPLCVALVDLDHFKRINDTLGHLAGDEVLREAARRLASAVRTSDFIGRYGGEEFLIIFRDIQKEFGRQRCEAIRKAVCESPIRFGSEELWITTSIGVAWTWGDIGVEDALVALADRALYTAKEKGRNRVELASTELETVSSSL